MSQPAASWESLAPRAAAVNVPSDITITTKRRYGWLAGGIIGALIVWILLYILKPGFILITDPNTGLKTASINNSAMGFWVLLGFIVGALVSRS